MNGLCSTGHKRHKHGRWSEICDRKIQTRAMMIWTRTCAEVCGGGSWVSWRSGYTHDTSPPFGRRWTFCARPKPDSHPSIMERSTLTPPSFLPESEDAKKWVWCQEAARRVSLSKDFMPAADGYSGNPVRILGSASTGHLHFDTMSDPVPR